MKEKFKKITWIFNQSRPGILLLIITTVMGSILSAISVYNAMISKSLIDSATSGQYNEVKKWLTVMGAIILFNIFFGTIRSLLSTLCSNKVSNELQRKFFEHITYSKYSEHSKHHSVGLLNRITSDTSTINTFLCSTFPSIITSLVMLSMSFFTLLKIEPFIAVFTVLIIPIILIMNKLFSKRLKKFYKDIQDKNIEYTSFIQESLQNIMIVKTFCREKDTVNKMENMQKEKLNLTLKQSLFSSCTGIFFSLGSSSAYFIVFAWGALSIVNGDITFGTMTALLQLFNKIQGPINSLMGCYSPIIQTIAAAERLIELEQMDLEESRYDIDISRYNKPCIKFENVNFSYKENKDILKNISFEINHGETVALVGPSGQGKTTIIKLILSLIQPNAGNIYINDIHKELISKDHRSLMSYIPQGNTLFSGSIRENIMYGNINASLDEINKACEMSCSLDFINDLENQFETELGEKGLGISEGQAQRLSIARSFLRNRPILILDEATSALDAKTEIEVLKSVKNLNHKPTCIIITHRPGALAICDRILRLEDGKLIEEDNDFMFESALDLA